MHECTNLKSDSNVRRHKEVYIGGSGNLAEWNRCGHHHGCYMSLRGRGGSQYFLWKLSFLTPNPSDGIFGIFYFILIWRKSSKCLCGSSHAWVTMFL